MTRRSVNLIQFWLRVCFYSIPPLAFATAAFIRFKTGYFSIDQVNSRSYIGLTVLITLVWALVIEHLHLGQVDTLLRLRTGMRMSLLATVYCTVSALSVLFFYRETMFARVFIAIGCALLFILSLVMMHLFRGLIYAVTRLPRGKFPIAIIGADEVASGVKQQLSCNPLTPCQVACFVALPGQPSTITDTPVLEWAHLEDVVQKFRCTEVLLALPLTRFSEARELLEIVQRLCVATRIVLHMGETSVTTDHIFDFYGVPLIDARKYPGDSVAYALGKRVFDVVFSTFVLTILSPVFLLIALLIKFTSTGPVFFAQDRIGLNGKVFRMYKFRSMHVTDSKESDTRWTKVGDPRCTALGAWLRKTSLDELPQFFNVIRGNMSIVGPRPERPHFVQQFLENVSRYNNRHYLKVGITGWAQVNGWRGDTSIHERVECDLYYLRNWSMGLDLKIIALTMFKGMTGRNAY